MPERGTSQEILHLYCDDRQTINEQNHVNGVFVLKAVTHLPDGGENIRFDLTYLTVQRPASIVVGIIGTHQGLTPIETSWKQEEECRKCG